MSESVPNTFGLKTSSDTDHSGTGCDILVGVFTAAGSFGCVIDGIGANELKYCDSQPDVPVYAFNHDARRWGTFVAVEKDCTDGLKINRLYMKNMDGEKYWSYENKWIDSDGHTPGIFSLWQVDSDFDNGYFNEQGWYYKQPQWEWYTETNMECPRVCGYDGGSVDRMVVCRQKQATVHNYISYDESECDPSGKPPRSMVCPAFACQWVQRFTDFNCMGSTASNQLTTEVTSAAQCQTDCANFSYAAWWDQTYKCRCYHVCPSLSAAPTAGGVYTNIVWEQIAA